MNAPSKKVSLIALGATALVCSRALFFFFNDPEGPNLLIVSALALAIYFLSLAVYAFVPAGMNGFKKLSAALCVQILSVVVLYFCMR